MQSPYARLWIVLSYSENSLEIRQAALGKGQTLLDDLAESGLDLRTVTADFLRSAAEDESRYEDATHLFKESLTLYQKLNDKWSQARVLHALGQATSIQGQRKVAESYFQHSFSLHKSIGDELGLTDVLLSLTEISLNQGNYKDHREMMIQRLEIAHEFGDRRSQPNILSSISSTFLYEARPEEALKYDLEALAIVEDMGDEGAIPSAFHGIAAMLMRLDDMEGAEPYINKGLRQAKTLGSSRMINIFLYQRSILHLDKSHYDLALEDAQVVFLSAQKQGDGSILAVVAVWLAWLHVIKGSYEEAERLIFTALSKYFRASNRALELTAYLLVRRDPQPKNLRYAWQLLALYEGFSIIHTFLPIQKLAKQFMPAVLLAMPTAEIEAAKTAGRELEWKVVIDELLEALPKLGWGITDEDIPQVNEKVELPIPQTSKPIQPEERFIMEELFATGGHGQVYLGRDVVSGQQVIIKKLKPELAIQQPEFIIRFIREGEALRQLNHPNIVKMLATIKNDDNEHLIVMEYVAGGNLRDLLDKTPQLPLKQLLDIGLELADALSRAHHLNIIHRDLKPSNVLLAEDGTPRLTDFGIAYLSNQETRLTQDNAMLGTLQYMSPEVCMGEELNGRTDIWSFGILLYEMLTGQQPFARETLTSTLIAIVNASLPDILQFRSDIPLALVELIESAVAKEQAQRTDSIRKIAAELETIKNNLLLEERARARHTSR